MKCPVCGYDSSIKYQDFNIKILESRTQKTIIAINKLFKVIKNFVPSDAGAYKHYYFLVKIKEVKDAVVVHIIEKYLNESMFSKGYGLSYIAAMMRNYGKNVENIKKMEKKRYGSSPPIRSI